MEVIGGLLRGELAIHRLYGDSAALLQFAKYLTEEPRGALRQGHGIPVSKPEVQCLLSCHHAFEPVGKVARRCRLVRFGLGCILNLAGNAGHERPPGRADTRNLSHIRNIRNSRSNRNLTAR